MSEVPSTTANTVLCNTLKGLQNASKCLERPFKRLKILENCKCPYQLAFCLTLVLFK